MSREVRKGIWRRRRIMRQEDPISPSSRLENPLCGPTRVQNDDEDNDHDDEEGDNENGDYDDGHLVLKTDKP